MYGHGSPHHMGTPPFRSPMHRPRYTSSPRFQQPAVPHFSGPGRPPGPMPTDFSYSPGQAPVPLMRTPPYHSYRSPRPEYSFNSPMHSSFEGSPYSNYTPGNGHGYERGRGRNKDNNAGGSEDINMYYNPNMLADPWQGMHPVPTSKPAAATT